MNLQDQLELEQSLIETGVHRYTKSVRKADDCGRSSDTLYGQRLMQSLIEPVTERLTKTIECMGARKTGAQRLGKFKKILKNVDPSVLSFITVKALVSCMHKEKTLSSMCIAVGGLLEDELRFKQLIDSNPKYYGTILRNMSDTNTKSYRHIRNVLSVSGAKQGSTWAAWSKEDKVGVGSMLIDAVLEGTDLLEVKTKKKGKHTNYVLVPTPSCVKWVEGFHNYMSVMDPYTKPCVIPPDDWVDFTNGGYWSEQMRERTPLVKGAEDISELARYADTSAVLRAVNAAQAVPWAVNTDVLEVLKAIWAAPDPVGLPSKTPIDIPKFDTRIDDNSSEADKARFKAWKAQVAPLYTAEIVRCSKALDVARSVSTAQRYSEYDRFWFVYQLDKRGRLYASSTGISPQGPDYTKALLKFADGMELGESGLYWLAVHGANCYGVDKVSFDDRVAWVEANLQNIRAVYEDAISTKEFWREADKPYQFLAFCLEFGEASLLEDPSSFISYIPVGMDGSCNGLQNFSALLRDDVGGKATNLVPADVPADIYTDVVNKTFDYIESAVHSTSRSEWLAFEKEHGRSRKLAKRSVMTLPYGSTKYSCLSFVREAVDEYGWEFTDPNAAIAYFTNFLWEAIGNTVIAARAAMDWLQDVANKATESGVALFWTSPIGFPVVQKYKETKSKTIRTTLLGGIRVAYRDSSPKLSKSKQRNGIAPNFVHSLDAAHMMFTVLHSVEQDIKHFALIHDDFGTHAANTEKFREIIKESFVRMYEFSEPLMDIYNELKYVLPSISEPPKTGKLDISEVLNSEYFFS